MKTPYVTIIMPVKNGERTLTAAIRSILMQSIEDFVLWIIDDGSDDHTASIVSSLTDKRIKYFRYNSSRGLGYRLNECIPNVRSPYIARMDADDIAFPRRIEVQALLLENTASANLCGSSVILIDEDSNIIGKRLAPKSHEDICSRAPYGFSVIHPTFFCTRTWLTKYNYNPAYVRAQDYEMLLRSYRQSYFINAEQSLLAYRFVNKLNLHNRIYSMRALLGRLKAGSEKHKIAGAITLHAIQYILSATRINRIRNPKVSPVSLDDVMTLKRVTSICNLSSNQGNQLF